MSNWYDGIQLAPMPAPPPPNGGNAWFDDVQLAPLPDSDSPQTATAPPGEDGRNAPAQAGSTPAAPSLLQLITGGRDAWGRAVDAVGNVAGEIGTAAGDIGRIAADTASFGFSDEALAKGGELLGLGSYEDRLAHERDLLSEARDRAGLAGTAAALTTGLATGTAAAKLPGIGRIVAPSAATPLIGRMAAGAATGAAGGGLYGFGSGEGEDDRTRSAAAGGLVGGAAGGLFPLVAEGLSRGVGHLVNRGTVNTARRGLEQAGVPEAVDGMNVAQPAARALRADGALAPGGMDRIGRDGALLMEAGPNSQAFADMAIQRGGPAAVQLQGAVGERVGRGAQAVTGALDDVLGPPVGTATARDTIRTGSAAARASAYDAANDIAVDTATGAGKKLPGLMARVPDSAIQQANRLMQLEGNQASRIVAQVADDGTVTFAQPLTVRQLDYVTRALNQAAEAGEGAGALGGQTTLGRAYQGLSRDIRSAVKEAVPEYRAALETAADPIRRSQAIDLGQKALSPGVRVDQLARDVRGMTGPEKQAVAQGIRAEIDHRMGNATRAMTDGNMDAREAVKALRDLSSRNNRDKVALVIGKEQAEALFDRLDEAARAFDLQAGLRANSRTYARGAAQEALDAATTPGLFSETASAGLTELHRPLLKRVTGTTLTSRQARQDKFTDEMAKVLAKRGAEAAGAARALGGYADALDARAGTTGAWREIFRPAPAGVAAFAVPAADDARNREGRRARRKREREARRKAAAE